MRVASIADHSTLSTRLRACATVAWMISSTSSSVLRIWCARWIGEVETKVWMRGRFACRTASPARAMSAEMARARPATTAFFTRWAISLTASKSPCEAIGKPASMMSTPICVEQLGDLQLLLEGHRRAGALLAVAKRGVEDHDAVLVALRLRLLAHFVWSFRIGGGTSAACIVRLSRSSPEDPPCAVHRRTRAAGAQGRLRRRARASGSARNLRAFRNSCGRRIEQHCRPLKLGLPFTGSARIPQWFRGRMRKAGRCPAFAMT